MNKVMKRFITVRICTFPQKVCDLLCAIYESGFKNPRQVILKTDHISEILPVKGDNKDNTVIVMSNGDIYVSTDDIGTINKDMFYPDSEEGD